VKHAAVLLAAILGGCGTLAPAAAAGVVMTAGEPNGAARFDLYDDAGGLCVGEARLAVYVPKDGASVRGCWVAGATGVHIVFLDGDKASIPFSALKKPEDV
jgi:hypothetical protein